jgi:hypothetical protein
MYSCKVRHFTFGNIPHAGKGWTLDVCALSRTDANQYVKNVHRGGKFIGENVKALCGATTQAAQEELRRALEKWMSEES